MTKPIYYHGGVPDLRKGQKILPPDKTGVSSQAIYGSGVCKTDAVYVTTDLSAAILFASGHPSGRGFVYIVKPSEPIKPDPDCQVEGLSFECDYATVVCRVRIKNKTMSRARKALLTFD